MPIIDCQVEKIEALTPIVSRVGLLPSEPMSYSAGQYLKVVMGEQDKRPFSIANAPTDDHKLELHIGAGEGNNYASEVLEKMVQQGHITVDGGHGNAFLREIAPCPTILLAGGTGFSYTFSILQKLLQQNSAEPIFLYWGTRTLDDMYAFDELVKLDKEIKHFRFMPVLEHPPAGWAGRTGWVHRAVLNDFVSLEPYHVYVAGRFEMAGVAREEFRQKGLLLENLYGDAYEFI
jgi:aquacobalamin reductase/NAD(P)H-flavin reductase